MRTERAIIHNYGNWAAVLCPTGHAIGTIKFNRDFAGSLDETEYGRWANEQPNHYDREAARCVEKHYLYA